MITKQMKIYTLGFLLILVFAAFADAQVCTPAPVGLVSWYAADGNALDSRSRNNGTLQNGATFAAGNVGQTFDLDGANDFVRVPGNSSLRPDKWTLEAWVFPRFLRPTINGFDAVITYGSTVDFGNAYILAFRNEKPYTAVTHSSGFTEINSNTTVTLNQWHHLAATFDGSTLRLYLDGVQIDSVAATSSLPFYDTNADVLIGADTNQNNPGIHFNGLIDEAAIYNRALSASEIGAIFDAGTAGKCKPTATTSPSGQVAWFAGDGNANDIAGTNNGTLQNGAGFAVGKVGQGFLLDGIDDFVQIPFSAGLGLSNFTVESWVKPTSQVNDPINQENIFGQSSGGPQLVVQTGTTGLIPRFQFKGVDNSFPGVSSAAEIPIGQFSLLLELLTAQR